MKAGTEFRLMEENATIVFNLNRAASRAASTAGLHLGNTRELAMLKRCCEEFLDIPFLRALCTENLPDSGGTVR